MRLAGLRVLVAQRDGGGNSTTAAMLEGQGAAVSLCAHASAPERLREGGYAMLLVEGADDRTLTGLACCRGVMPVVVLAPGAMGSEAAAFYQGGADAVLMDASPDTVIAGVEAAMGQTAMGGMEPPGNDSPAAPDEVAEPEIDNAAWAGLEAAVGADAFGQLLGKVDGDIAAAHARLEAAVPAGDIRELREATHILMAVAGAIGAVGLQSLAERLNRAAHAEDDADIAALGSDILSEGARVLDYVRARYEV